MPLIGAVLALLAVAAGAFGAHSLKGVLSADLLAVFETAARYQIYHALGMILVGVAGAGQAKLPWLRRAGMSFLVGMVLFCGSLYAMAFTGVRWLGALTPLGGLAFMIGWGCFALAYWRVGVK